MMDKVQKHHSLCDLSSDIAILSYVEN